MEQQKLSTIYWKEEYKNNLTDTIMKEEKTIKYLKNIIKYFEINNIEKYEKFDKRDLAKIEKYLEEKHLTYWNHCQDNIYITTNNDIIISKTLYLVINNDKQYNTNIDIYSKHFDNSIEYHNVKEQAKNRLAYIEEKHKQNKKILKNFDAYMDQYNKNIKNFKKFIDKTHLNNIVDIYIYAREDD